MGGRFALFEKKSSVSRNEVWRFPSAMKKTLCIALTVLVLQFASITASFATPAIATSGEDPIKLRRTEMRLGMLVGGSDIGDVRGPSVGLHAALGRRFGDVTLVAEYNYMGVGDGPYEGNARDGSLSRGGLVMRYSLLTIDKKRVPLGADFWVEAGTGYQHVAWDGGGVLNRNDVVAGFGMQLDGKPGFRTDQPRYVGPFFAFRAVWARAPRTNDPVTCAGPCSDPTRPSRNDVSMFFHFGMHWGR